jgi:hypothetical protein
MMTLAEIEEAMQEHIRLLSKDDDFEISEWLAVSSALAQVKQAQASERIADALERIEKIMRNGIPVERVS